MNRGSKLSMLDRAVIGVFVIFVTSVGVRAGAQEYDRHPGIITRDAPSFTSQSGSGISPVQVANSGRFCLSDTEVDQVLVPVSLHKLGAMLGTCMRKYPKLENEGRESNSKFHTKYSADVDKSASVATQVLTSRGVTAVELKQLLQAAHNVAIKTAEAYDEKQCKNVVSFMEFVIASDSFEPVRTMAHTDFPSARANTPACASNPAEK